MICLNGSRRNRHLLYQRRADAIDLQSQCKQAHWNVKGDSFIALHELFHKFNEDVEDYVDLIAERSVQLGGTADGTVRMVAKRSLLSEYSEPSENRKDHIEALSHALANIWRICKARYRVCNAASRSLPPDARRKGPKEERPAASDGPHRPINSAQTMESRWKDLILKIPRPQQSDGPQYTQRWWVLSLQPAPKWLPDQGSNLGPAD